MFPSTAVFTGMYGWANKLQELEIKWGSKFKEMVEYRGEQAYIHIGEMLKCKWFAGQFSELESVLVPVQMGHSGLYWFSWVFVYQWAPALDCF